jgi:hypothetical protein
MHTAQTRLGMWLQLVQHGMAFWKASERLLPIGQTYKLQNNAQQCGNTMTIANDRSGEDVLCCGLECRCSPTTVWNITCGPSSAAIGCVITLHARKLVSVISNAILDPHWLLCWIPVCAGARHRLCQSRN